MPELLRQLALVNLASSGAVLAVLALRPAARAWFGADVAMRLWALPLVAAVAVLIPRVQDHAPSAPEFWRGLDSHQSATLVGAWLFGVLLAMAYVGRLHLAFLRDVRGERAGPAVLGLFAPRIIMPASGAFSADERALIRDHEREHIRRKDPAWRALITLAQCLNWFNPLVHLAAEAARLDQELACDAAVVRRTGRRRLYAEALLKSQTLNGPSLECRWTPGRRHPLEVRVAALAARPLSPMRRSCGAALAAMTALSAGLVAWSVQPPQAPDPRYQWPPPPDFPPPPSASTLPAIDPVDLTPSKVTEPAPN